MSQTASPFPERVAKALRDPILQRTLGSATHGFSEKRIAVLASLPDPDRLRDYAHALRAHTISHLDEYLPQFAAAAEETGAQVHWATDATHAQEIVLALARTHGVKSVVKSKSMVSEEIDLQPGAGGSRIEGGRERPGRVHRPVGWGDTLPYRRARYSQDERTGGRIVPPTSGHPLH